MTLREFLDAAYALLVAEYQRLGANLTDALAETAMWRDGGKEEEEGPVQPGYERRAAERAARSSEEVTAAQNDQALAMLQGMIAGVSRV
jgi:hypothetical protein